LTLRSLSSVNRRHKAQFHEKIPVQLRQRGGYRNVDNLYMQDAQPLPGRGPCSIQPMESLAQRKLSEISRLLCLCASG
jgi:hypothetical protein